METGQNGTHGSCVRPHVDQGQREGPDAVIILPNLMADVFVTEIIPIWIFAIHKIVLVCILNDIRV